MQCARPPAFVVPAAGTLGRGGRCSAAQATPRAPLLGPPLLPPRSCPTVWLPAVRLQVTKYVEREIINHRQLVHPHIIQFKEVFLTPQHLSIAMEYAAGGDMFEYVVRKGGLRESEARWFFQQLIVAVDYIHRMVGGRARAGRAVAAREPLGQCSS